MSTFYWFSSKFSTSRFLTFPFPCDSHHATPLLATVKWFRTFNKLFVRANCLLHDSLVHIPPFLCFYNWMKDIITSKNATFSLFLQLAVYTHCFCHDIIKCLKEIFKFIKTLFTPFSLTFSLPLPPLPSFRFSLALLNKKILL